MPGDTWDEWGEDAAWVADLVLGQLVVGEDGVLVLAAGVLEVVCSPHLHVVHGKQLESDQAQDGCGAVAEGHGALQGSLVPEHIWPHNLLHANREIYESVP